MLAPQSTYNLRFYAESHKVARVLADAMRSEGFLRGKCISVVQPGEDATRLAAFKGKPYILVEGIHTRDAAELFHGYSGILGATSVVWSDGAAHETDVSEDFRALQAGIPRKGCALALVV